MSTGRAPRLAFALLLAAAVCPQQRSSAQHDRVAVLPNQKSADEFSEQFRRQTARIVEAITAAAQENARLSPRREEPREDRNRDSRNASRRFRVEGDALTDLYIRAAAAAAAKQRDGEPARAFVVALGVALDDTGTFADNPLVQLIIDDVEPQVHRRARLRVLGKPALRGRHDLLLHFAVSAALAGLAGEATAETAGIQKELSDARGKEAGRGTGFSFADLAADYAGIELAETLLADRQRAQAKLRWLAKAFRGRDFLPAVSRLLEGLSYTALTEQFGEPAQKRFLRATQYVRNFVRTATGWSRLRNAQSPNPPPPNSGQREPSAP